MLVVPFCSSSSYQEKKRNTLRDFLNVSGPMGVTHFLMLSKTASSLSLRVARTPQGPTLTFKIHQYSLASDIAQSQLRPRCPQDLFKSPPLVINLTSLTPKLGFVICCLRMSNFSWFRLSFLDSVLKSCI